MQELRFSHGLQYYVGPREAKAEYELLQQAEVIDAALREDIDTLCLDVSRPYARAHAIPAGTSPLQASVFTT